MELIDQIMSQISDYVTDPMVVSNCLYIAMQDYSITKKSTELTEYVPDSNDVLIKKFLVVKKIKGCTDRTLKYYGNELRMHLLFTGRRFRGSPASGDAAVRARPHYH